MNEKQSTLIPGTSATLDVLPDLDRNVVIPLALRVLQVIEPRCVRTAIAGSLRRLKPTVNDVDIVVQPRPDMWLQVIKTIRSEFNAVTGKQGDKLATMYLPLKIPAESRSGHVQVDLYRAEPQAWGILLLVRTGSKEHNVKLCNLAIQKGLRLKYSVGLVDDSGRVVAGRTEEEVFQALGLPYIQPKDREVQP